MAFSNATQLQFIPVLEKDGSFLDSFNLGAWVMNGHKLASPKPNSLFTLPPESVSYRM